MVQQAPRHKYFPAPTYSKGFAVPLGNPFKFNDLQRRITAALLVALFFPISWAVKEIASCGCSIMYALPTVAKVKEIKNRAEHLEPVGPKKKNVAFFSGCLMDTVFMKTNEATKKLLQYAGCDILSLKLSFSK